MQRISHPTAVPDLNGPGKPGFTEGVAGSTPATRVTSAWLNLVQEEIAGVIEGAGITLDINNKEQLAQAIALHLAQATPNATQLVAGLTRYADGPETIAGLLGSAAVTPTGLALLTATIARRGLIQLATGAQVIDGIDTDKAVTSAGLAALTSTDTRRGLIQLATVAQVLAGLDTERAITSAALAALHASETVRGLVQLATAGDAQGFVEGTKALTAATLAATYKGANQSMGSAPRFQKHPSGRIEIFGTSNLNGSTAVTFPFAFPNACFGVALLRTSSSSGDAEYCQITSHSQTGFSAIGLVGNATWVGGTFTIDWKAEGY